MKLIAYTISLFIGIGQNLPYEALYISGIGLGDFLLISTIAAEFLKNDTRKIFLVEVSRHQQLFVLIYLFVLLTLLSSLVNSFGRDITNSDMIEAMRPFYYFLVIIYFITRIRKYGASVITAFVLGILISGVVSFIESENRDVIGFVMLWNPNVIGNMIAVGVVLISLLFFSGKIVSGVILAAPLLVLSIMTYSKGTWLMVLLGLVACFIAAMNARSEYVRLSKFVLLSFTVGFIAVLIENYESVYELIEFKLLTTQFGDSAAEGGTTAARWGFARASVQLALENPLFGVGITNFETAYDNLQEMLGSDYWPSDNPHSAWLYLIACFGIPASIIFLLIFYIFAIRFYRILPLAGYSRALYYSTVILVLLISGATQMQLVTQHFFWFVIAVVFGLKLDGVGIPTSRVHFKRL